MKLTRGFLIILCGSLALHYSCKKPKITEPLEEPDYDVRPGQPANAKKISGYFFAGNDDYNYGNPRLYYWWRKMLFATFSDPPRNLAAAYNIHSMNSQGITNGNLSFGEVKFFHLPLKVESNTDRMYYHRELLETFSVTPRDSSTTWTVAGTGELPGFSFTFGDVFPKVNADSGFVLKVSRSKDVKIPVRSLLSNFDSAMVVNTSNLAFGKGAGAIKDTLYISGKELGEWLGTPFYINSMRLQGVKYFHARTGGRTYQFVFSSSVRLPVIVNP